MKLITKNLSEDGRVKLIGYIQEPSKEMTDVQSKPAILIFPGGVYMFLSAREAEPVALAYAAQGFQTFVLYYSVGKYAKGFQPLKEASDAIRYIRDNAEKFYVIPDQIAVCGFSAGGHLACAVGLMGENRPNAMILGYPAIIAAATLEEARISPTPIVQYLKSGNDITEEELNRLNLNRQVGNDAPPAFIWHTFEDECVDIENTVKLVDEYSKRHLPFEYHVFQHGEHGLSLSTPILANGRKSMVEPDAAKWFCLSVDWLRKLFGEIELTDKPWENPFL